MTLVTAGTRLGETGLGGFVSNRIIAVVVVLPHKKLLPNGLRCVKCECYRGSMVGCSIRHRPKLLQRLVDLAQETYRVQSFVLCGQGFLLFLPQHP